MICHDYADLAGDTTQRTGLGKLTRHTGQRNSEMPLSRKLPSDLTWLNFGAASRDPAGKGTDSMSTSAYAVQVLSELYISTLEEAATTNYRYPNAHQAHELRVFSAAVTTFYLWPETDG